MKRDMDLVRKILLAMEAGELGPIAGYDQAVVGHHVWLMLQGHIIEAATSTTQGDAHPVALPIAITSEGHDFLDTVRDDTVWATVKAIQQDKEISLPFTLLQQLATKILAAHVGLGHE
jgi:hypothetical protein